MKNYYAILEVPVGSDVGAIRESYRRLVQENLWNKEAFAELKEAYEILTTPARRNEYDRATFGETFPASDGGEGADMQDAARMGTASSRQCPVGAAAQCPVIRARDPLPETFCPECGVLLAKLPMGRFEPPAALDPSRQIRLQELDGREHRLRRGISGVGREAADVLLTDKTVSRQHAQIEVSDEGVVSVEDQGSTNGTRINDELLAPYAPRRLTEGDVVRFGSVSLTLRLPTATTGGSGTLPQVPSTPSLAETEEDTDAGHRARGRLIDTRGEMGYDCLLVPGVTTFGRRAENSVVIRDDPYVSGSHAQIIADEDTFRLTDLGSTNGTYLNGAQIAPNEPRLLTPGDEIAIGGTVYRFERLMEEERSEPAPVEIGANEADSEVSHDAAAGAGLASLDEG